MSIAEELAIDLTSDAHELARVREAVQQWAVKTGWSEEEAADIMLAVDEALSNVIRHGYDGKPGQPIELRARTVHDSRRGEGLEIVIRDYGKQVPLDQICGRDLDDIRPGGLGVHIIRSVMSEVNYEHAEGGGIRLTMRKYRTAGVADADVPREEP